MMSKTRTMPIRRQIDATERDGVNFVRTIIESANCIFKEVDRAYDYGHDALIHLVDGENVSAVEFAVQIKSGASYRRGAGFSFRATAAQMNFWARHPLDTLAIVYDPAENCAWWVDLKEQCITFGVHKEAALCLVPREEWNKFDDHGFREILLPYMLGQSPRLSFDKALDWAVSNEFSTHDIGVKALLANYKNQKETWKTILREFHSRGRESSFSVYFGLIRPFGHPDLGCIQDQIPKEIRDEIISEIISFEKSQLIELLHFIGDGGCERGAAGYGLFALIPNIKNCLLILSEIERDEKVEVHIRENAALLLSIAKNDPDWWRLWIKDD